MSAPRVLISSVTSWNDSVGADTYSTLFADYDSDRLANLYIREETPNSRACKLYFKISESRVLRSVLNRRVQTGKELRGEELTPDESDLAAQRDTASRYERHRRRRSWILLYAREILWLLGRWRTPELDAFLDEFKPDVVLFGMEGYIHFNRINRYIMKRTGARGLGYFYDDNFTYKQKPRSLGYRVYRFFQRRDLKKTAGYCSAFFAISPKTKRECDEFFGIDSVLLTKPVEAIMQTPVLRTTAHPVRMLYTGNLLYGRLRTLHLLSDALRVVNETDERIVLDVYTTTQLNEEELRGLAASVQVMGVIPQGAAIELQRDADVLLFIEDIDGADSQMARLSFSTKLTDYFAAGRAILAVADPTTAPMEYLMAENAALCASTREQLVVQLQRVAESPDLVAEYALRASDCGRRNHSASAIRARLCDTIHAVAEAE